MNSNYLILTEDYLLNAVARGCSSMDIARDINGNARTVRWYMKRNGVVGLKTKPHFVWNKGVRACDDDRVLRSARAAHASRKGKPAWNKGKLLPCLSEETKHKLSIALRGKYIGPSSSNWKGGTSPIHKRIRSSAAFKEWRKRVFERDNYTCQQCRKRGLELHPHHIKSFAHYIDLRFEILNGVTLCRACHMNTDTWGNRKAA